MFVRPSLVGGTLGRSNWKSIKESPYFVLQQRGNSAPTQQNNNKRRHYTEYRIITKGFPHYRVSDNDDLNQIQDAFDILHDEVLPEVEGKKTSKKILKQLKSWCASNENLTLPSDEEEEGDGYATDTSITPEEGNSSNEMEDQDNDNYPLISPEVNISSSSSTKSENAAITTPTTPINNRKGKSTMIIEGEDHDIPEQLDFTVNNSDYSDIQSSDGSDNDGGADENNINSNGPAVDEWISIGASMLDSLMGWLEGPPLEGATASLSTSSRHVNHNASSNNKNETILDIPMQFIDLLTYPEIDPKASKKASFAVLREISFVKQRRKVLFLLTLYMFIMRLCSFDLFLVLVFVSNCAMLFLMKNSGKVNVTMAKRAVRQRIGWAKQWAGSLFKNKTNNIAHNITGHTSNRKNSNINPNAYANTVNAGTINNVGAVGVKITPTSPTRTTNMTKSTSQDAIQSGSISDTTHGGSVSTKINIPKRGFFRNKNNQTGTTSQIYNKEDKAISSNTETSSLIGTSPLQKSSSDYSLPSTAGVNLSMQSSIPQISSSISGGVGIVNESSQSTNTFSNTATIHGPTTRRRFFKRNNHPNNTYNPNHSNASPDDPSSTYKSSQSTSTFSMANVTNFTGAVIEASNGNEGLQQINNNSSTFTADSDLLANDFNCEG
ncbi:hypothetical protein RclHR1_07160013 [Rhizophagus clarus]|uniref:Uncharacterized protein n=1 Tax=Rhizophagus clarus TaxID=94130 RepID=A0A2Z6S7R0_9GLOM|nr:hypothetical protein RclHR1_07160013 [Rhizophagus clarus]GES72993.1 hypothetical protein GLOIN_2v18181 [Rhizophagus clarus]